VHIIYNNSLHEVFIDMNKFHIKKNLTNTNYHRILGLSTFLRELRINSGYTQAQVANEIHLSRNSISKIENQWFFRIQHLFLLADFYRIPIRDIFSEIV